MNKDLNEAFDFIPNIDTILRKKNLIGIISFLGFLLGVSYSIFASRIWEGNFQIIISKETKELPGDLPSGLSSIVSSKLGSERKIKNSGSNPQKSFCTYASL